MAVGTVLALLKVFCKVFRTCALFVGSLCGSPTEVFFIGALAIVKQLSSVLLSVVI